MLQILSEKNMAAEMDPHNSNDMLPCTQSYNCVTELCLRCGVEWRRRQPIKDSQIWHIIEIKFLPGDFHTFPQKHRICDPGLHLFKDIKDRPLCLLGVQELLPLLQSSQGSQAMRFYLLATLAVSLMVIIGDEAATRNSWGVGQRQVKVLYLRYGLEQYRVSRSFNQIQHRSQWTTDDPGRIPEASSQ